MTPATDPPSPRQPPMRKISVLMATVFLDMLGFAMVFPLLPYYALQLDAEPWVIGWMIATYSIAQIVSAPLWGRVSDRFGRRPALMVGLLASTVAFVLFGLATSVLMLFLSRLIQGAGGAIAGVAQAYVGDVVAAEERARALGWLSAAASAGVMIGPALGSLATTVTPEAPGLLAAGLCFANLLFAWRWLPESSGANGVPKRPIRAVVWETIQHPGRDVSRLVWIYAIGMLGFMSSTAVTALYLGARFGVTERTIGIFFLFIGGLSLFMRAVALGPLLARFGEVGVLRLGAVTLAIGLAATPIAPTVPALLPLLALWPIGTACLFPATSALVTRWAAAEETGQTLGVQQAFGGVARVFAPIWATFVFQTVAPGTPFLIAGAIVAGAAVVALGLRTPQPARLAEEPT